MSRFSQGREWMVAGAVALLVFAIVLYLLAQPYFQGGSFFQVGEKEACRWASIRG